VVDIEATCVDTEHGEVFPVGEESEIIEIGIAELDIDKGEVTRTWDYIIKPKHSKVSKFCTDLTTLTQEVVDKRVPFEHAIKEMIKTGTKSRVWASFGEYDKKMFKKQCEARGVEYPFHEQHLNVKTLFCFKNKIHKGVGTHKAVEHLGLTFEGTPHRGIDDAKMIAKILASVLK
jgi:inhibitor of KinA sporulation pathway (predicted exonuclease)